jgi:hypothetical protein
MLNVIFEKLLTPIKISKTTNKHSEAAKKHLVIQTVYSSGNKTPANNTSLDISKSNNTMLSHTDVETLDKQKEILLNDIQYKYYSIEQVVLDRSTVLVGLTRHAQPILHGIFMFPENVQNSIEWDAMKQKAACLKAGIAIFQPIQTVTCLKLKQAGAEDCQYLIDHRAISRIQWLWHSSNSSSESASS